MDDGVRNDPEQKLGCLMTANRHTFSPHSHLFFFYSYLLGLINIISCFSLWLNSAFSYKTQACVSYFCSMVAFRTSHLWLLGGYLSCAHSDYPCLMEAKWLKADSSWNVKTRQPKWRPTETNRETKIYPPLKSKAQGARARQLLKQHEREGVGMLRYFARKT